MTSPATGAYISRATLNLGVYLGSPEQAPSGSGHSVPCVRKRLL